MADAPQQTPDPKTAPAPNGKAPAQGVKPAGPAPTGDQTEAAKALLQAKRLTDELASTRAERDKLKQDLEGLKGLDAKERTRILELIKKDPENGLKELGYSLADLSRTVMARRQQTGKDGKPTQAGGVDPALRQELEDLKAWRKAQEEREAERQKKDAEAQHQARGQAVLSAIQTHVEEAVKGWDKEAPGEKDREVAAGDELFLADLKEDPQGWTRRLTAYAEKYPEKTAEDARRFYGDILLTRWRKRAQLSRVGALLGGSQSDSPSDTQGSEAADGPRARTRKSGGSPPPKKRTHGLALDEVDEEKSRRRLAGFTRR